MARSDRFRQELVNHFREKREALRRQWVRQMSGAAGIWERGKGSDERGARLHCHFD
jgi:hypothetical protein